VALDLSASGTRERLDIDLGGRVRRIQRHYEAVTWPFSSGVACSLLPVTCGLVVDEENFASLADLRRALNAAGVPSRDLPLRGHALDLTEERGLLQLSERLVLEASRGAEGAAGPILVGERQRIDPSARLVGPLVLHADVEIGAESIVLGPTVLGPGARIGAGALLAQGLVASGIEVPPRWTLRHRAVFERLPAAPPALRESEPPLYRGPDAPLQPSAGPGAAPVPLGSYARVKPALEAALAAIALILLSPILLLVALLVRLESRGPALYGHKREGKDGRPFHCWKFRTMFDGAEAQQRALLATNQVDGPQFKMERDPRITRVGHWLRPTSIDELPQLINVALGQMSLVGPRPSPFRENQLCVPWREGRLSVRPGITGLWQVCRHDRQEGDFHQWIQFDLLYVRHASFWVDLKIVLATLWTRGGKTNVPLDWILPPVPLPPSQLEQSRRDSDTPMLRAS
jgi:lipopolysaccharide/colanic/teichoic acid biosynthesis glycosyltransferase